MMYGITPSFILQYHDSLKSKLQTWSIEKVCRRDTMSLLEDVNLFLNMDCITSCFFVFLEREILLPNDQFGDD